MRWPLAKLASKLRARGFDLVTISADEPEQEAAATSIDENWFGGLPAMVLYDRTGKKAGAFLGETPVTELEAAIAKLL